MRKVLASNSVRRTIESRDDAGSLRPSSTERAKSTLSNKSDTDEPLFLCVHDLAKDCPIPPIADKGPSTAQDISTTTSSQKTHREQSHDEVVVVRVSIRHVMGLCAHFAKGKKKDGSRRKDRDYSLVLGYAELLPRYTGPEINASTKPLESKPVGVSDAMDPNSHLKWPRRRNTNSNKRGDSLYWSLPLSQTHETIGGSNREKRILDIVVGVKRGDEKLPLGRASFEVNGTLFGRQKVDLVLWPLVTPSQSKARKGLFGGRSHSTPRSSSFRHEELLYELSDTATLRADIDVGRGMAQWACTSLIGSSRTNSTPFVEALLDKILSGGDSTQKTKNILDRDETKLESQQKQEEPASSAIPGEQEAQRAGGGAKNRLDVSRILPAAQAHQGTGAAASTTPVQRSIKIESAAIPATTVKGNIGGIEIDKPTIRDCSEAHQIPIMRQPRHGAAAPSVGLYSLMCCLAPETGELSDDQPFAEDPKGPDSNGEMNDGPPIEVDDEDAMERLTFSFSGGLKEKHVEAAPASGLNNVLHRLKHSLSLEKTSSLLGLDRAAERLYEEVARVGLYSFDLSTNNYESSVVSYSSSDSSVASIINATIVSDVSSLMSSHTSGSEGNSATVSL